MADNLSVNDISVRHVQIYIYIYILLIVCPGRPLPLETTASEEMTIMDNMVMFEKNGFRFKV